MQKIKNNNLGVGVVHIVLVFSVILIIIFSATFYFSRTKVNCSKSDQIILTGFLRGFRKTDRNYFEVYISNRTYWFYYFEEVYMRQLIGYNVSITCCQRVNETFHYQRLYYDMLSAEILEKTP